jgi:DNA-binding HxlR family transcriptional regulator
MAKAKAAAKPKPTRGAGEFSAKLRRGEVLSADCPSRDVLKHVTSRWGVLVLVALSSGTHRFGDLRRKVEGVSEKMLAQTLQWLEHDGFVDRKSLPVMPPHVEYSLTALGQDVAGHVESLANWLEGNLPRIMNARRASGARGRSRAA